MEDDLASALNLISISDKKHKEEIARLKADYEKRIKAAEDHAAEVESRCARDNEMAAKARREGEEYRDKYEQLLEKEEAHIDELADQKIADEKKYLRETKKAEVEAIRIACDKKIERHRVLFALMYSAKETWHVVAFAFCIMWDFIQTLSSTYLRGQFVEFGGYIKEYVGFVRSHTGLWVKALADKALLISDARVAAVVYWIITILMALVLVLFFYGVPLGVIVGGGRAYLSSKKYDKIARWLMISSAIAVIALSSECVGVRLPLNAILLWLIIQVAYPVIRYILIPFGSMVCVNISEMSEDSRKELITAIIYAVLIIGGAWIILWATSSFVREVSAMMTPQ